MWNLLKKNREECNKLQDLLEESGAALPEATSSETLSAAWPAAQREHMATCADCQEAAQDLLDTRELFKGVDSSTEMAKPWFATRVMAAVVARERELAEAASAWLAVPKFASRLALASGALLLVASMWLYEERPLPAANPHASILAAQESLFEAPPPMNQDDVLVNVQESNP
jgi:hypothetical protein